MILLFFHRILCAGTCNVRAISYNVNDFQQDVTKDYDKDDGTENREYPQGQGMLL